MLTEKLVFPSIHELATKESITISNSVRGTGYIGSFTVLALLEADYKVVIVDNCYNSSKEVINRIELISGKRPDFYQVDVTDEAALDEVFSKHPDIDNVIHFAALKVSQNKMRQLIAQFTCIIEGFR